VEELDETQRTMGMVKVTIGRPGIEISAPKTRKLTPPMPGSTKKVQINNTPQVSSGNKTPRSRRKNKKKKVRPMKEVYTPNGPNLQEVKEEEEPEEQFKPSPIPPSPKRKPFGNSNTPGSRNIPAADVVKTPLNDYGIANALSDSVLIIPSKSKNQEAFIPNDKIQYRNQSFGANEGIDFYIDYARFLPDNTTVTK